MKSGKPTSGSGKRPCSSGDSDRLKCQSRKLDSGRGACRARSGARRTTPNRSASSIRRSISASPSSTPRRPTDGAIPRRWSARPSRAPRKGRDRDQSGPEPSRTGGRREGAGRLAEAPADRLRRRLFHPLAEPGCAARRDDGRVRAIARGGPHPGARRVKLRRKGDGRRAAAWNYRRAAAALQHAVARSGGGDSSLLPRAQYRRDAL